MALTPDVRRFIVRPFLAELDAVKLKTSVPLHVVHRRVLLAEHVLADVEGDDLEGMALRALAEAMIALCWSPRDRDIIDCYLTARRGYLEVQQAQYDSQ